jgi:hypothetical protein
MFETSQYRQKLGRWKTEDGQDANASIANGMGHFWLRTHEKIPTYAHAAIKKSFAFKNVSLLYDGC